MMMLGSTEMSVTEIGMEVNSKEEMMMLLLSERSGGSMSVTTPVRTVSQQPPARKG